MSDPHLNLFYSYDNASLEDNVTRALLVTLSQLGSVHQRLVLRDLLLPEAFTNNGDGPELVQREGLRFDLQVHAGDDHRETEDELLTADNGALIGIHHSVEEVDIDPEGLRDPKGAARVDALIEDQANDLSAVIEVKLGSSFNSAQLRRHHRRFFDTSQASFDDVFGAVSWTELVGYLNDLAKTCASGREKFVLEEFVKFANMIGLAPFLGFDDVDFRDENRQSLQRFLSALERNIITDPPFVPHGARRRLNFEDIDPNLWVDYREGGLEIGLVCGADKKRYAARYRDILVDREGNAENLFSELAERAEQVDDRITLVLTPRARFFGTRVQVETARVGRTFRIPDELPAVRELFSNKKLNPHDRISRREITERFGRWLEGREEDFGPDGLFMRWPDLDKKGVLTTLYFHFGYRIPQHMLTGRDRKATLELVNPLLQSLASAARSLYTLRRK